MSDLEKVVHSALKDDDFRQKLQDDPSGALKSLGINPTAQMVNSVQHLNYGSLQNMAKAFGHDTGGAAN